MNYAHREHWRRRHEFFSRIRHLREDWLTPVEYLPYIDALLGDIDLDPCSTHFANSQFLRAKRIYTYEEDGLNMEEPWKGKVYLFPPTYGRNSFNKERGTWRWSTKAGAGAAAPSVVWFRRLYREWKLRNVSEALFFTTYPEIQRVCQEIWDFPMCFPKDRANCIHGKALFRFFAPIHWGFFVYLPPPSLGFEQTERFKEIFSHIGRVIV
mgnify:CR=1 FL=1